ncbi:MAG: DUF4349 domain-containing protein [Oscillospiraceae bacterium]|nr:DUF4349 domain-containing protein [Oscillospiraceae bacterium]
MKKREIAALLAAVMLTACGASNSSTSYDVYETSPAYKSVQGDYAAEAETAAAAEDYRDNSDAAVGGESPGEMTANSADTSTQLSAAAKMIYTATLQLETLEYDSTVSSVKTDIESMGGFVETSSESNDNKRWYYDKSVVTNRVFTVRARIPSENFNEFVSKVGSYGQKMYESTNAENISRQYADTDAQIKALEKEEERLLEMMESAYTIEDMIVVEDRITEVQSQLNTLRSRLSSMDSDVRYSTVNVTVTEVHEYTEVAAEPEPEPTFFERTGELIADSAKSFLRVLEGILDFVIMTFPYLVIIGVVLFFVIRGRKKKKAALPQADKAEENKDTNIKQ